MENPPDNRKPDHAKKTQERYRRNFDQLFGAPTAYIRKNSNVYVRK